MSANVFLRKKISDRIGKGHQWIFKNEIGTIEGCLTPGDLVFVFSSTGSFVGKGYYNPDSVMAIRLLTYDKELEINREFFVNQISNALNLRRLSGELPVVCRLVSREADFLPGLAVDKIGDLIIFRIYTLGMELLKGFVAEALIHIFPDYPIFEKDDGGHRKMEQLPLLNKFWRGALDFPYSFSFYNTLLRADPITNSGPGYFWDQFYSFEELSPFLRGKKILDAFCGGGGFTLPAAKYGAKFVTGLDWDEKMIEQSQLLAQQNHLEEVTCFKKVNSFTEMVVATRDYAPFELIILDMPPIFSPHRDFGKSLLGYERLIRQSIRLLSRGGLVLLTQSGHLYPVEPLFERVNQVAIEEGFRWQIIKELKQPRDHPVLWNVPATRYFQGWLIRFS